MQMIRSTKAIVFHCTADLSKKHQRNERIIWFFKRYDAHFRAFHHHSHHSFIHEIYPYKFIVDVDEMWSMLLIIEWLNGCMHGVWHIEFRCIYLKQLHGNGKNTSYWSNGVGRNKVTRIKVAANVTIAIECCEWSAKWKGV